MRLAIDCVPWTSNCTILGEMCALRSIRIRRKGSGNYPGKGTDHVNGDAIHSPTPCGSKREDVRDRLFPMDVDICLDDSLAEWSKALVHLVLTILHKHVPP